MDAELHPLVNAFDDAILVCGNLEKLLGGHIPLETFVHSWTVLNVISKDSRTAEHKASERRLRLKGELQARCTEPHRMDTTKWGRRRYIKVGTDYEQLDNVTGDEQQYDGSWRNGMACKTSIDYGGVIVGSDGGMEADHFVLREQ